MTAYSTKTDAATITETWIETTATLTELQALATEWGIKPQGNSRWRKSYFEPLKAERDRLLSAMTLPHPPKAIAPVVEAVIPVVEVTPAPVADLQETIARLRLYSALDSGLIVGDKAAVKAALKAFRDKHGVEVRVALNKRWEEVKPEAERILWAHKYGKRQAMAEAAALVEEVEPAPVVEEVIPTVEAAEPAPVALQDTPAYFRRLNVVSLISRVIPAPSDRLSAPLRQRMGGTAIALYNAAKGQITPQRAIALAKLFSRNYREVIAA